MLQRRIYQLLLVLTTYRFIIVGATTSTTNPHKKLYTSPVYKRYYYDSRDHKEHPELSHIIFVPVAEYEEVSTTYTVETSVPTFALSDQVDPEVPPTITSCCTSTSDPMPTPTSSNNSSNYYYDGDDDSDDSTTTNISESANDDRREASQRAQAQKQSAQMHEIEVVLLGVGGVIMVTAILVGGLVVHRRRKSATQQHSDEETSSPIDPTMNKIINSTALSTHLPITSLDLPPLLPLQPLSHIITNIETQRSSYFDHPTAPSAKEFSDSPDSYSNQKNTSLRRPSIYQYQPSETTTLDITDLPAYTPSAPLYKDLSPCNSDDEESDEKG